jgi:plastocyanin
MLGLTAPASAVWIADPPMTVDVQVPNNGQLCPGDTVTVVVSDSDTWLDGQAPSHSFATTYTVKVLGPGKNTGNQGSPSSLQFTEPGTYTIIVEADDAGTPVHEGPITKTITVEVKCDCPQGGGDGGDGGGGCGSGSCSSAGGGSVSLANRRV